MTMRRQRLILTVLLLGLLFLAGPALYRMWVLGLNARTYVPPAVEPAALAATPEPTPTPKVLSQRVAGIQPTLRRGPIVIDYGHFNQVSAAGWQPLAAALAERGLSTRIWLSEVDPLSIESAADLPEQSAQLKRQLADAGGMIIVSPLILYSNEEVKVLEQFVADGGRLLLISDPDIFGDTAVYMNLVAEPFGIVFNDDYLYDTTRNDKNYTHFFAGEFLDQAERLEGSQIAFYGGRSIDGDVTAQVRSAATTLSSRRSGVSGFTTVALGGLDDGAGALDGRVLALSDFDVLTEPNVARHDNARLVDYVADFFAAASRTNNVADFPAYLGREVTLYIGVEGALDADTLLLGAKLQRTLEESGRTLRLAGAPRNGQAATGALAQIEVDALLPQSTLAARHTLTPTFTAIPAPTLAPTVTVAAAGPTATATRSPGPTVTITATSPVSPLATISPTQTPAPISESAKLTATDAASLTATAPATVTIPDSTALPPPPNDEIILGDFDYANEHTSLLRDASILLVTELVTPTVQATPPTATPTATPTPTAAATIAPTATPAPTVVAEPTLPSNQQPTPEPEASPEGGVPAPGAPGETGTGTNRTGPDETLQSSTALTVTVPLTATPTATATPALVEVTYLVGGDGLRLLAAETALVFQRQRADGTRVVAVLGADGRGIEAGVQRLLDNNFDDCIIGFEVTYCPVKGSGTTPAPPANGSATAKPTALPSPAGGTPQPGGATRILIVDDNAAAAEGERSEADRYLQGLAAAGRSGDLWLTAQKGAPTVADMQPYKWVIWSNAGYAKSQIDISYLEQIFEYLNGGGHMTISSLSPFFGMGIDPASPVRDLEVVGDEPTLVEGLERGTITLEGDGPAVTSLAQPEGGEGFEVALKRGPASGNAGAPIVISATDEGEPSAVDARLIIIGMSVSWLPGDVSNTFIRNMAVWMAGTTP